MRSKKQQQASKLNGSKSKGPVTPEGKARSSQNAITHGMHARAIVLAGEDDDKYSQLQAEYFNYWQPETIIETDLVNDIATSRWRLNRLLANETAVLDAEIDRQREAVSEEFKTIDQCRPYYYYSGNWYIPAYQGWDIEYYPTVPPIGMAFQWPPAPFQLVRRGPNVYAVSQGVYYQQLLNGGLVYYRVAGYAWQ